MLLIIPLGAALLTLIILFGMGIYSHFGDPPALMDGELARCADSPNCVCSAYPDDKRHYVEPLQLGETPVVQAKRQLSRIIDEMGGEVVTVEGDYLSATFTSTVFRFVDDLQLKIEPDQGVIQVRSASRVGHGDFGVNRKRVAQLRELWSQKQQ